MPDYASENVAFDVESHAEYRRQRPAKMRRRDGFSKRRRPTAHNGIHRRRTKHYGV